VDRTARILGGWVVGCLIVGGSLIVANVPLGTPWTDQQTALVRLGAIAIVCGAAGLALELFLVLQSLRTRPENSITAVAKPADSDDPAEIALLRARLAALDAEKAAEQRRMLASALRDMANESESMRSDHETGSDAFLSRWGSARSWATADQWDTKVKRVLARDTADDPTLLRDFAATIDPMALSDPDWRVNLVRFLAIKTTRLRDIADRLEVPR
jgi:hypothetical protein